MISAGEGIGAKPSILMSSNEKPACCFTSFNFGVCINNHIKKSAEAAQVSGFGHKQNKYPCPIIRRRPRKNSRGRLKVIALANGKSRAMHSYCPRAVLRRTRRFTVGAFEAGRFVSSWSGSAVFVLRLCRSRNFPVRVIQPGEIGQWQGLLDELFDRSQLRQLFRRNQRISFSRFSCASRSADTVNVVFCLLRQFVVDDLRKLFNI